LSVVVIDCGDDPVGVIEVIILWVLDIGIGYRIIGYCMIEKKVLDEESRK